MNLKKTANITKARAVEQQGNVSLFVMEHHGVLTKTLARLTELWDQIGVSEDVRTGAVEALNQRLARVCEETVGAVQAERGARPSSFTSASQTRSRAPRRGRQPSKGLS